MTKILEGALAAARSVVAGLLFVPAILGLLAVVGVSAVTDYEHEEI